MAKQITQIALEAGSTFHTNGVSIDINSYEQTAIADVSPQYVGYFFQFGYPALFLTANTSAQKIELEFYHYGAETDAVNVDFVACYFVLPDFPPAIFAALDSADVIVEEKLSGKEKKKVRITLGETGSTICNLYDTYYTDLLAGIMLGIRITDTNPPVRTISFGGLTLAEGEWSAWSTANLAAAELAAPPRLILTLNHDTTREVDFDMRYTTADPTSDQSTPQNSIGGFFSPNDVFEKTEIASIVKDSSSSLSVYDAVSEDYDSKLVQFGPEVARFSTTDSLTLNGLTRGVSPGSGYAAITFPEAEATFYLDTNRLFDNEPKSNAQYRCVALINNGSPINNATFSVIANKNPSIEIDIGIEYPLFNLTQATYSGVSGSTSTLTTVTAAILLKDDGYYDGCMILTETDDASIVESFSVSDGTATFTLETPVTLDNGQWFRIYPPSSTVSNETVAPSGSRFLDFIGDGGVSDPSSYRGSTIMETGDFLYLWIRRTLAEKQMAKPSSGAVILIRGEI